MKPPKKKQRKSVTGDNALERSLMKKGSTLKGKYYSLPLKAPYSLKIDILLPKKSFIN